METLSLNAVVRIRQWMPLIYLASVISMGLSFVPSAKAQPPRRDSVIHDTTYVVYDSSRSGADTEKVYHTYVPPPWAPPYDNVSTVRYYYLPDCEVYYDVWEGVWWYPEEGVWMSHPGVLRPPWCGGIDLYTSFFVLIDWNVFRPWKHHAYYRENYPAHFYDHYRPIVVRNGIIQNVPADRELVARAFNENTNRVTFMQGALAHDAAVINSKNPSPSLAHPAETPRVYDRVVHEVPMRVLTPSMPAESRSYNYGSGYSRGRGRK